MTLVYHAVDAAGNVEADNTMHLLVDNVAPTSTLLGVDTLPHNAPVTLTLSAVDAAIGGYAYGSNVASISYRVDAAPAVTTPGLGPLAVTLGEGDHHVAYWSTDNAGNVEAARTVYVRVAAPLPPNLIKDPGTQISSFDNASDWTRVGSQWDGRGQHCAGQGGDRLAAAFDWKSGHDGHRSEEPGLGHRHVEHAERRRHPLLGIRALRPDAFRVHVQAAPVARC